MEHASSTRGEPSLYQKLQPRHEHESFELSEDTRAKLDQAGADFRSKIQEQMFNERNPWLPQFSRN